MNMCKACPAVGASSDSSGQFYCLFFGLHLCGRDSSDMS